MTESEPSPGSSQGGGIEPPPRTILGICRRLGPGLIIAGSIVGSGELIATTKTGAQAGYCLLWLIVVGCVIKVFAQIELGRYAISSGKTTMEALNEVPGPRRGTNWVLWYWLVMFIVTLAQLGGIVGGVGQSLAMTVPIDGSFNELLQDQDKWDDEADKIRLDLEQEESDEQLAERIGRVRPSWKTPGYFWTDDIYWAILVTVVTVALLINGRYGMIQSVSIFFVASFTAVTIFNLFALQSHAELAVGWGDLKDGFRFQLPPAVKDLAKSPLATALATFGLIGVGANELITYPYWCLEKGYARFTGPRDQTPEWAERARGWLRVMRWDACISMLIFTLATVAFYLLGAAVLYPNPDLDPAGSRMIRTLAEMYVPVFGPSAQLLFLFGAFAVLYSTFFVANAGHARVASDAVRVFGVGAKTERTRLRWIRAFCVIFPVVSVSICILMRSPVELVKAGGVAQAIMLPILATATLYFRYRRCDRRIAPGRLWDLFLWISAFGLLVAGGWIALMKLFPALEQLG